MSGGKDYPRMQIPEQPLDGGTSSPDQSLGTLLRDVDEFLNYIAIVKTPEVDEVRENLERSLRMAKHELLNAVARVRRRAAGRAAVRALGNPWSAVAAAALLGAGCGKVLHDLTRRRRHRVR
jgi:ElaB/YqjD/DUF883 family membrane-anchored ribosome-binding protein